MLVSAQQQLSHFALDVAEGLSRPGQKKLAPRYFYDDLGSSLFEAITLLPEYGLTRADERLLKLHAGDIARAAGNVAIVSELGSGSGKKTSHIIRSLQTNGRGVTYRPIDVSSLALAFCERELGTLCEVMPVCDDWLGGLDEIARERTGIGSMLLLFLGSSIGNLDRCEIPEFLRQLRGRLQPNDYLLLGADLVKDRDTMIAAYDDPTGVTAAFNLNVLGRINRELGADFDLRSFGHEVRWNEAERRIEMHLVSFRNQTVTVSALDFLFRFAAGETIWTESSHKFTEQELCEFATSTGFDPVASWNDSEWPFLEALWRV
ncbi:MAG: L-histidine N(alpha)-methyltransferase [Bryobacteraceae bacterium]